MITVRGLTKTFNQELAVNNLDLHVKKGAIYGLLGSNGAGKTTLLKNIVGIYRPNKGNVSIAGEAVYENVSIKQRLVFIPDALYFLPQSSINQMGDYYRKFYPSWNEERFKKLEQVFHIDPKRKIHRLSKGMQRQVAFWIALSCMPDVLVLDEPIDGLDPVMRQKIKNLLFQDVAEREMTILISSHNLREVEDICDHIGIMHQGKLIVEKELDDLKSDTHKIQVAFDDSKKLELLKGHLHVLHVEKRGSVSVMIVKGRQSEVEAKVRLQKPILFDSLPLTLEEIFIYEMGGIGYEIENILI